MKCSQGHENPEEARFCGVCGESVLTPSPMDGSVNPDDADSDVSDTSKDLQDLFDDQAEVTDSDTDDDPDPVDATPSEFLLEETEVDEPLELEIGPADSIIQSSTNTAATYGSTGTAPVLHEITAWADKYDILVESEPYLDGLTKAVSRRDDLTMWASLNPFEYLPEEPGPGKIVAVLRNATSLLFLLRNILVFIPVALTWFAISQAVDNFGDYTEAMSQEGLAQTANFLQFWQSSSAWWRIGHIAFLDFLLISGIVALTIAHSATSARAARSSMHAKRDFERDRQNLGFSILRSLEGKKQANPESIAESLAEALNDLTQAARDVNEVAMRLERASTGVESLTPQIETLNSRMGELVTTFNSGLVGSMDHFADSVLSLDKTVAGGVAKMFEDTLIGVQEINEQLARTGASIEFGTKQLRDDLDAIHGRLASVTNRSR